jgi:hypothetical protein
MSRGPTSPIEAAGLADEVMDRKDRQNESVPRIHQWLHSQGVEIGKSALYQWIHRRRRKKNGIKRVDAVETVTEVQAKALKIAAQVEVVSSRSNFRECYDEAINLSRNPRATLAQVKAVEVGLKAAMIEVMTQSD